ncbi:hypothetical protein [Streptosporangium saharense]|uniref:hypothetical protein n=1 Tax=Streptosporangium saharense TaxID=1706840 RepID=UPI00332A977F
MTTYTLSIVEGGAGRQGEDIFSPDSPVTFDDLGPGVLLWLTDHGYAEPGRRVVVTPVGEVPSGALASRDVDL